MNNLHFALIGKSLSHSFSKQYFEAKFKSLGLEGYDYSLLETPNLDSLHTLIKSHSLTGFNVTIPYKKVIIPLLDEIDPVAEEIGAVNTVKVTMSNGRPSLKGFNTDAPAFRQTLQPHITHHHRHALVLGTGGAAQAVAWALRQLDIEHIFVSRNPKQHQNSIGYDDIIKKRQSDFGHSIIVNATPVGMYPIVDASPWPDPDLISSDTICYDLIYNPSPTRFLQDASSRGAITIDGLDMLHLQADMAFSIMRQ